MGALSAGVVEVSKSCDILVDVADGHVVEVSLAVVEDVLVAQPSGQLSFLAFVLDVGTDS